MTSRFPVFAVTFAAVYAAVYYFAVDYNWALFSYGPAVGEWTLFTHPASAGPTMYWYGWIATSALAGAFAGLVVCLLPMSVEPASVVGPCLAGARVRDGRIRISSQRLLDAINCLVRAPQVRRGAATSGNTSHDA